MVRDPDIITGCSTNTMDPVLIHGNTVDLFFHSDGFMTGKGFNITWQEHNSTYWSMAKMLYVDYFSSF